MLLLMCFVAHSLCGVCCELFVNVRCVLPVVVLVLVFIACCLLLVAGCGRRLLFVALRCWRLLLAVCSSSCVVCWLLFVVDFAPCVHVYCSSLRVIVCCCWCRRLLLFVVCCLLCVVCCCVFVVVCLLLFVRCRVFVVVVCCQVFVVV